MREFRAVRDDGDTRNGERDDARRRATCVAVRTCEPVVTLERSSRGLRRLVRRHPNARSSRSDSKRDGEKTRWHAFVRLAGPRPARRYLKKLAKRSRSMNGTTTLRPTVPASALRRST